MGDTSSWVVDPTAWPVILPIPSTASQASLPLLPTWIVNALWLLPVNPVMLIELNESLVKILRTPIKKSYFVCRNKTLYNNNYAGILWIQYFLVAERVTLYVIRMMKMQINNWCSKLNV